jgi:shikimate kinase
MPGVGKTHYGSNAAVKFNADFYDLDEVLEKHAQMPIYILFEKIGEPAFRKLEIEQLQSLVIQCKSDTIIATGGGTASITGAMDWMKEIGKVIWLDTEIKHLLDNLRLDFAHRPLFKGLTEIELEQKLLTLETERRPFYEQSDYKLNVYRGLIADLFTKRLGLSTFGKK